MRAPVVRTAWRDDERTQIASDRVTATGGQPIHRAADLARKALTCARRRDPRRGARPASRPASTARPLGLDLISSQNQHGRAGAGDDRRRARARAATPTSAMVSGIAGGPVVLVQAVLGGGEQRLAARRSAPRTSRALGRRRTPRRRAGPIGAAARARASVDDSNGGTSTTGRRTGSTVRRTARRARPRPGDRQPAEQAGGDVVGMALELGGERERVARRGAAASPSATRPGRAALRRRWRPPTSRARGRAGSRLRATQREAGRLAAQLGRRRAHRPHDEMGLVARDVAAPSPSTSMSSPSLVDPSDEVVVQGERQAERVETRAEVGAGGGHPHVHRSGAKRRSCPARAPRQPRARRPAP